MSSALCVVLDTNVIVSGIAYPGSTPGKIVNAWRHGTIRVVLSTFILDELRRVLPRLSNRHGLSQTEIEEFVDLLSFEAEIIDPAVPPDNAVRDPMDLPVLGTLVAGLEAKGIDYLVTGDKDLLDRADAYPIVTPAAFWAKHG